jgi:hypothetical protein
MVLTPKAIASRSPIERRCKALGVLRPLSRSENQNALQTSAVNLVAETGKRARPEHDTGREGFVDERLHFLFPRSMDKTQMALRRAVARHPDRPALKPAGAVRIERLDLGSRQTRHIGLDGVAEPNLKVGEMPGRVGR